MIQNSAVALDGTLCLVNQDRLRPIIVDDLSKWETVGFSVQVYNFMVKPGFSGSAYDHCVYHKKAPSRSLIYLLLYVDVMLVVAKDMEEVKKLKILLSIESDLKDLGAARKFLGMEIIRDRKHVKSVNTPSSENFCLSTTCAPQIEAELEYMSRIPYAGAVGSLMLSGKRALECGEKNFSLFEGTFDLASFTVVIVNICWKATLQPSVALSTTKVEYMALREAAKEEIWLKGLIEDLGFSQDQVTVFCDNMSAIFLATDQVYHDRTKHIDVRYHFIRTERRIKVKKIGTQDNPADVFTKPVPLSKFRHCLDLLNIDNWKYGVT
ncbi:retrovirus-related pol polyprotein from transposon TNT 1-94 [Tanacetum coccineum]